MDLLHSGWFFNKCDGLTVAIKVKEILCEEKTNYQNILFFKSDNFGNVLVVNGVVQCTERDASLYHEMMAHLSLSSHSNPKKVLVIGCSNGGVVSEVAKLSVIEEIHVCLKDQRIIELSKQYLPIMSAGFSSDKVTIHIENEITSFLEKSTNSYDVIIVDSFGDNEFSTKCFYERVNKALKQDGIVCSAAGCIWTNVEVVKNLKGIFQCIFPVVGYAFGLVVPAFVGGQIGLMLGSKNKDTVFEKPVHENKDEDLKLQYYNREIHRACFVLPQFAKDALEN